MSDKFYRMACWMLTSLVSFPRCGNALSKPLDSGLRRNDDEREKVGCHPDNPSAMPAEFLTPSPHRHSGEGRNPVVYSIHSCLP